MRTLKEIADDKRRAKGKAIGQPVLVIQAKGDAQVRRMTEIHQRRGYVLESVVPQGRKRVVLTFRLQGETDERG